jgi:hypothetical protein
MLTVTCLVGVWSLGQSLNPRPEIYNYLTIVGASESLQLAAAEGVVNDRH